MYMTQPAKTLNVTEARRLLPKILRSVALGAGPVVIGRRGQGQAVLVKREEYEALQARSRDEVTWEDLRMEVAGTDDDVDRALAELRAENRAHFEHRMSRSVPAPRGLTRGKKRQERRA
jgi:prevent-host-death family protein